MFLNSGFFIGWGWNGSIRRFEPGPGSDRWQPLQVEAAPPPVDCERASVRKSVSPVTAFPPARGVGGVRFRFSRGFGTNRMVLTKLVYAVISGAVNSGPPIRSVKVELKAAKFALSPLQW